MLDSNEIFNHGLNTHRLMRDFIGTTEHAEDLERQLFECKRELRMLENKEIAPLVSARFAELKKSLLSDIENILDDYP